MGPILAAVWEDGAGWGSAAGILLWALKLSSYTDWGQ